jgi:hypothetical protein
MDNPMCAVLNCLAPARWALLPGYESGKGKHLCEHHWKRIREESNILSECYTAVTETFREKAAHIRGTKSKRHAFHGMKEKSTVRGR